MRDRHSWILCAFIICCGLLVENRSAVGYEAAVEKQALRTALEQYSSCNQTCATDLAVVIVDKTIEEGLDLIASLQTLATAKNKLMRAALFYTLARRAVERGEKIVSTHGACAQECDKLHSDVVTLARAGLLGPMLRDGRIDSAVFANPKILAVYIKYLKPIPPENLPWHFHNQDWWRRVRDSA
jgi:hypothetical protein